MNEIVAASEDDAVAAFLAERGVSVSRPVTAETLHELVALTTELLGVADVLRPTGVRAHSDQVQSKNATDVQSDFLNSFFVDDLQQIAAAVIAGDCGTALATYLTPDSAVAQIPRVDARGADRDAVVLDWLAPAHTPAGRWPAKATHPLATSQQLAINSITSRLMDDAGMFAVNGPPGTGKTTMLRDLIAAIVVARAERLADLPTPAAGFTEQTAGWQTDKYPRRIRVLRPELTGFEIVVASANNAAVANVTKEIPLLRAVDGDWAEDASYYAEHASRVLGEPAWGLAAAALGKKGNRIEFVKRFWYGDTADRDKPRGSEGPGFLDWLTATELDGTGARWPEARAAFRTAVATERRMREQRQRAHDALRRIPDLERAHRSAAQQATQAETAWQQADHAARAAAITLANTRAAAGAALARRREHLAAKPGILEILFTLGKAIRRWHTEDEPLAGTLADAERTAHLAAGHADQTARAANAAARHRADAAQRSQTAERALADARTTLDQTVATSQGCVPDAAWLADDRRRELHGAWLDEQWNTARTRVFLAALRLHEAFVVANAALVREGLRVTMDVLSGVCPPDASRESVRAGWQLLFLIVPVVSTTFASMARLFPQLGREDLGWLLIDEAGQAAPQQAAGAIWRAKRVVAVGDPLQLEPVVTVLRTTQQALREHHGVDRTWSPGEVSVQTLADRITSLGTTLPGPDDTEVWVGAPLRVHRRCDNPMFDIVNTAVYNGLMIHAVPPRDGLLDLPDSTWFDVRSIDNEGNWIPAEGEMAERVVANLIDNRNLPAAEILVVSPFRAAKRPLERGLGARYPSLLSGTVHTAQGREADVVVLILGGNPNRPGVRNWAAERPNLFNVAVSRAKRRIYVIGDHDSWSKQRYFAQLARVLPPFEA